MEKVIEKCPVCGNYTEGVPTYSKTRELTQKTASTATAKFLGSIIGGIIGFPLGGIGAIPGMIFGAMIASSIGKKTAEKVDKVLYEDTKLTFSCLGCGKTWYKVVKNGTSNLVPDHILQKQKDEMVAKYNKKASDCVKPLIISCIMFGVGFILCLSCDEEDFSYILSWMLMIISFPGIISNFRAYISNNNKAEQYKQMSLSEFISTK